MERKPPTLAALIQRIARIKEELEPIGATLAEPVRSEVGTIVVMLDMLTGDIGRFDPNASPSLQESVVVLERSLTKMREELAALKLKLAN